MKIAIVTYSLMIGGIETVIFNQAKYFISGGNEVTIIETLKRGDWIPYFKRNNIRVIDILPNILFSKIKHAKRIAKELKKYDVILLHDAPFAQSTLGVLPAETIIIPVLHSSPESMIINSLSNYGQWNKIVYVSPYLKEILLKTGILRDTQITNIPNGIEIPAASFKEESDAHKGRKFIFLGRLEHAEKAVLYIPEIIKRVMLKTGIEEVNIYGEGSSKEALNRKIKELSLENTIKLHGSINHEAVYDVLKRHDFLLMPSFFEGHPLVLLEAMVCKTIPFVSDLRGRTDFVVDHGINGFLCTAADIDDFSSKIIDALNRADLGHIGERARETIVSKFSVEAMGKEYIDLIMSLITEEMKIKRSGEICLELLGDLPTLPIIMIRPVRKILRFVHLWN